MSALAEMERGIISERQKDVHKDRRERGVVWGVDMGPMNKTSKEVKERIIKENPELQLFFDKNDNLLDGETALEKYKNISPEMRKRFAPGVAETFSKITSALPNTPGSTFMNIIAKGAEGFEYLFSTNKVYQRGVTKAFDSMHDDLVSKMSDNKYVDNPPPFILKGGKALSSTRSGYKVLPQAWPSAGVQHFKQFANGFQATDLDGVNNVITFNGVSKHAFDQSAASTTDEDVVNQTKMGKMIIEDLITEMSHPKNTLKPFALEAQAIAAGDPNKSAYIIKPTREFLEKYKAKDGEPGLTSTDINNIATNGLAYIGKYNNQIFQSSLFNAFLDDLITLKVIT
jgi:hypothetical protein